MVVAQKYWLTVLWGSKVLCDRIGPPAEYRPPAPIVKAQVLCDYKVLYATDHPPILADQKANLLKITESRKLNWTQIFNLPTFY